MIMFQHPHNSAEQLAESANQPTEQFDRLDVDYLNKLDLRFADRTKNAEAKKQNPGSGFLFDPENPHPIPTGRTDLIDTPNQEALGKPAPSLRRSLGRLAMAARSGTVAAWNGAKRGVNWSADKADAAIIRVSTTLTSEFKPIRGRHRRPIGPVRPT